VDASQRAARFGLPNDVLGATIIASLGLTLPMHRTCPLNVPGAFGAARPWAGINSMAKRSGGLRRPAPI
jgi:hypothetical protein